MFWTSANELLEIAVIGCRVSKGKVVTFFFWKGGGVPFNTDYSILGSILGSPY